MSASTILPFTPDSNESVKAIERYRLRYRLARTVTDFAETAKLGGIVVGGVFVVAASITGQLRWHFGFPVASLLLLACAVVAVLAAHVWEKIFRALGCLLEMSVDSAVSSSPFLSNTQRAAAMSWGQEASKVISIQTKVA